jgi:hypothetical protein
MPRLSLTAKQLETAAGAELLNICQGITDDGALSDDEVAMLHDWLQRNPSDDLPAQVHLNRMVAAILEDGVITDNERRVLYQAIEAILPPDLRPLARLRRLDREAAERQSAKDARLAEAETLRQQKALNRPLVRANFMVAGVRYEDRPALIARYVNEGDDACLRRDPLNRYSRNAIEVRTLNGHMVGYVPEDDAVELAPLLDDGGPYYAQFRRVLRGGRCPIPVVNATIYGPDATVADLRHDALDAAPASRAAPQGTVKPAEVEMPRGTARPTKDDAPTWILWLTVALILMLLLFAGLFRS